MAGNEPREAAKLDLQATHLEEGFMVGEDRWQEIRRLRDVDHVPIAEIARRLELDRKTVRHCLKQTAWQPYQRPERTDTLLAEHAEFLRERAPAVGYSAQVLFQELKGRGYAGGYDTVKRFVRPLRTVEALAERATVRFETAPGHQSQIDWGAARVHFRHQPVVLHFFVLTLGYSRRHYMEPALNERVPQFLDAHERAFDHFGGHTREHLYDRPRTICSPDGQGGVVSNSADPEMGWLLVIATASLAACSGRPFTQGTPIAQSPIIPPSKRRWPNWIIDPHISTSLRCARRSLLRARHATIPHPTTASRVWRHPMPSSRFPSRPVVMSRSHNAWRHCQRSKLPTKLRPPMSPLAGLVRQDVHRPNRASGIDPRLRAHYKANLMVIEIRSDRCPCNITRQYFYAYARCIHHQ
jgi:hypothetical protein